MTAHVVLAMAFAAALPGVASAQAQAEPAGALSTPEARLAIEAYGKCAADRQRGEAERLLRMNFTSTNYETGLRVLSHDVERRCARDAVEPRSVMRSANLLFAGAMAEAILETGDTPLNARIARQAEAQVKPFSPTDAIAQCLARSLPDQVSILFATAPGSDAETAAAAPLSEAVPACARVSQLSQNFELSVAALRAMIATASYRLINAGEADA